MDSQLLVRIYNVGLGDCIYLRVPDEQKDVHILIDCGNKFGELELLGKHIADLKKELPDAGQGKKRLDLLVVTHPHEDHHKGFEEDFFGTSRSSASGSARRSTDPTRKRRVSMPCKMLPSAP